MIAPIIAYASDEVGGAATLSSSETAQTDYPATNVQTLDPREVFLTDALGAAGVRLVWDHGEDVDVKVFSLHHHNFPAGTVIRIQRNGSNTWGGPSIDVEYTIAEHPVPGLPYAFAVDLTLEPGYSDAGFAFSSLLIPALPDQLIGIGSVLWWSQARKNAVDMLAQLQSVVQLPTKVFRTALGGREKYRFRVREQAVGGVMPLGNLDADEYAGFVDLFNACQGCFYPFLWWMRPKDSDQAWLADFGSDTAESVENNGQLTVQIQVQELSGGLPIPTDLPEDES